MNFGPYSQQFKLEEMKTVTDHFKYAFGVKLVMNIKSVMGGMCPNS